MTSNTLVPQRHSIADGMNTTQVPFCALHSIAPHSIALAQPCLAAADAIATPSSTAFSSGATALHPVPLDRALTDRIRREFFARACIGARQYGITLDEVIVHLEHANLGGTPGAARVLSFIEDLVLAVALVRGHPQAWYDAWQKHESVLIRACQLRLDQTHAILFARRFWVDLFAATVERSPSPRFTTGSHAALTPLGEYVGVRPLRIWLTDRLLGRLELEAVRCSRTVGLSASSKPVGPFVFRIPRATRPRGSGGGISGRLRLVD